MADIKASDYFPSGTGGPQIIPVYDVATTKQLTKDMNLLIGHDAATAMEFILPVSPADFTIIRLTDNLRACTSLDNKYLRIPAGETYTINELAEDMALNLPGRVYTLTYYQGDWAVSL